MRVPSFAPDSTPSTESAEPSAVSKPKPSQGETSGNPALATFESLAQEYYEKVYQFLLRHTGDPQQAKDLTQEVFVLAWQRFGSLRDRSLFLNWMFRIASNGFASFKRNEKRPSRLKVQGDIAFSAAAERVQAPIPSPEETLQARDLNLALENALQGLSDRQRNALLLRSEGLSYAEIVAELGGEEPSMRARVRRAREKLARLLGLEV